MKRNDLSLFVLAAVSSLIFTHASEPDWVLNLPDLKGDSYRKELKTHKLGSELSNEIKLFIQDHEISQSVKTNGKILLARVSDPDVFQEFTKRTEDWSQMQKTGMWPQRQGAFSAMVYSFATKGPETRYVYEADHDKDAEFSQKVGGTGNVRGLYKKKVITYTEADVAKGIQRNAAARCAVLEAFLKYVDEYEPFEQKDLIDVTLRLWVPTRNKNQMSPEENYILDEVAAVLDEEKVALEVAIHAAKSIYRYRPNQANVFFEGFVMGEVDSHDFKRNLEEVLNYLVESKNKTVLKKLTEFQFKDRRTKERVRSAFDLLTD